MVTTDAASSGDLLHRYRTAAGLTREELAERAGLSAHAISDLERGASCSPYRETIRMLADALQLTGSEREACLAASRPDSPAAPADTNRSYQQLRTFLFFDLRTYTRFTRERGDEAAAAPQQALRAAIQLQERFSQQTETDQSLPLTGSNPPVVCSNLGQT